MDRKQNIQAALKKAFCLSPRLTVAIAIPSFVFVFVMLGVDATPPHTPLFYLACLLSSYALVITITGAPGVVRSMQRSLAVRPLQRQIRQHPLGARYLDDAIFRSMISLYSSLLINALYAAFKLISGLRFHSSWFISLAAYYLLLALMRFLLLRHVNKNNVGTNLPSEWRRYRLCGVLLFLMNIVLVGVVVLVIHQDGAFVYPGNLIYLMALYTFYALITAGINVAKFQKYGSPVLSAAKVISLTAALVSLFALETAMIARFSAPGNDDFRFWMTSVSGMLICMLVLGMAIVMMVRAAVHLSKK